MRFSLLRLMLAMAVSLSLVRLSSATTKNTAPVETFEVNLDLPPQERWTEIIMKYKDRMVKIMDWLSHLVPPRALSDITAAADVAEHFFPKDLRQEMEGIAHIFGIPVGQVLMMNLIYELAAACTSVVAQHANGTMWHGRNLDFDIPGLQGITVHVRFVRGQRQLVYEGTTYAGYIGVPTGMKPGAFTISQDERNTGGGSLWENVAEWIFKGGKAYSFLYREILEDAVDYNDALARLQTTTLIAPSYFIIAGTGKGQGAVVSRERDSAVDTWTIDTTDSNRWFLVQTNDDHWLPPQDSRRTATNEHMKACCSPDTISSDSMFDLMNMQPTLNELTTYTSVLSAGSNYFYSVVQNVNATDMEGHESKIHWSSAW